MAIIFNQSNIVAAYAGTSAIDKIFQGTDLLWQKQASGPTYVMATDSDFSGTTDGKFKYIGTGEYIIIPNVIKGVSVTSYASMFNGYTGLQLKGVASYNPNINILSSIFEGLKTTTLDVSNFNTSNVEGMYAAFKDSQVLSLDLTTWDTSKVDNVGGMFWGSQATSVDLSNFSFPNATSMIRMFMDSKMTTIDLSGASVTHITRFDLAFTGCAATTGYAKTNNDAIKLNNAYQSGKPTGLRFVVKP